MSLPTLNPVIIITVVAIVVVPVVQLLAALKVGQAVANIQMATIDPGLRNMIKKSADNLEAKKEELSLVMLQYELERIFTYLMGETKNNKGYIPLQDRLNVAEFGLLESQVEAMSTQEKDTDVLQVVSDQVTDLKRRLGIDYYVTGLSFDREAIQRWIMELYVKSKQGLAFYVKGCQLFWNDIVFCSSLVLQALQGYTLKPREVRTLRYVSRKNHQRETEGIMPSGSPDNVVLPTVLSSCSVSACLFHPNLFLPYCFIHHPQTNIQGCHQLYPVRDHPHHPVVPRRTRVGVWCHPAGLSRLFPQLLHGTETEPAGIVREHRVHRGDHQGELERKGGADPGGTRVPHRELHQEHDC